MGARTRSNTGSPVKKAARGIDVEQKQPLRTFVLPKDLSSGARFLLLPHPREQAKTRFLFCPVRGLFEFKKISAPSLDPRSLLFSAPATSPALAQQVEAPQRISHGYINKDAEFFVATQFDPLFLLLPLLPSKIMGSTKPLFQPIDDLLETHIEQDEHLRYLVRHGRVLLESSMTQFCDSIEAGETMFRVNEDKVVQLLIQRAQRVVVAGLPQSLEERFVTRVLEAPVLSIKREDSTATIQQESSSAPDEPAADSLDSQSTTTSTAPSLVFSEVSTVSSINTIPLDTTAPEIKHLQRIKVVINFIFASYLNDTATKSVWERIEQDEKMDFKPLQSHLDHLTSLRSQALASRSLGDFSRKRGCADDEEASELRAEKKRKQDEEEKRKKANESRAVRDLKKVNVIGMKKMSDFFTKKSTTTKAKS